MKFTEVLETVTETGKTLKALGAEYRIIVQLDGGTDLKVQSNEFVEREDARG